MYSGPLLASLLVGQLMAPSQEAYYKSRLPIIVDEQYANALNKGIWYTSREMPRAYQDWESDLPGIHSPYYNKSAVQSEPFGNANREFPWDQPGGGDFSQYVRSVKVLYLPKRIAWGRNRSRLYWWIFPQGTMFFEILFQQHERNLYAFEIRVRIREERDWGVDILLPVVNEEHLSKLRDKEAPGLEITLTDREGTLIDNRHPRRRAFASKARYKLLSAMPVSFVKRALKEPFQSVLVSGRPKWSSHAEFGIVSKNYAGPFIGTDRDSCMNCHVHTSHSVNDFDPQRDWYGRVRGSDGIFSWHPFDSSCISLNGKNRGVAFSAFWRNYMFSWTRAHAKEYQTLRKEYYR